MNQLLAFLLSINVTTVHLSFDDGPDPKYTPQILKILKDNNYQADFFMVGSRVKEHPKNVQDVLDGGNDIGGHSMTHKELTKIPFEQAKAEILDSMKAVNAYQDTKLFRFPYGSYNKKLNDVVVSNGYKRVDWDVDTTDWKYPDEETIYKKFKVRIKKVNSDEAIILMHDIHPQTVKSFKMIVKYLQDNNIRVVKLNRK
jgi:peptidoglycan/xylan/chitin deacetylase (PgdA/CDA1 family)